MRSVMDRRAILRHALSALASVGLQQSGLAAIAGEPSRSASLLSAKFESPVLFAGDAKNAYRDPAAIYHDGWFYLYFTWIRTEEDGIPYSYVAWSRSRELRYWTEPVILTPRDKNLDFGSPGDVVRRRGRWILCLQTYPRPNGERYGNQNSRIWTMSSRDLHRSQFPEDDPRGGFDNYASIGFAWSDDLNNWNWS